MSPRKAQLSSPTKVRILEEYKIHGKKHHHISNLLNERGYNISPYQVRYFIHRYEKTGNIDRAPGSARPSKINNPAILSIIQAEMEKSDETSAEDVHAAVCREMGDDNYPLSVRSCSRARKKLLQYDCKEKKYGALVRVKNVPLRLEFAKEMLDKMQNGYTFEDRVFVDECTCKVDAGAGKGFVRRGQKTKKNRRPKHPSSVHVWAGISKRGKTFIVIFTGIMCKEEYAEILKMGLLPFTANAYPDGDWALWQDNDPKHSSRYMQKFYEENGITWYKTPAESPDLNPIELIWARLKAWLKKEAKPKTVPELVAAIEHFWENMVDTKMCCTYINHMYKSIPKVIELGGHLE